MLCQGQGSRSKYRHKGNIMISHKEHGHPLEGLPATVGEVTEMMKKMTMMITLKTMERKKTQNMTRWWIRILAIR